MASKRVRYLTIFLAVSTVLALWFFFKMRIIFFLIEPVLPFDAASAPPLPDYNNLSSWLLHPDQTQPRPGFTEIQASNPEEQKKADLFFVYPTSHFSPFSWNEKLKAERAAKKGEWAVLAQASIFAPFTRVYAPFYRQATLASFWDNENGRKARDLAYTDVLRAFDAYTQHYNHERPIILAGHSQGAEHLSRLLHDRFSGKELKNRLVAAYIVGRPFPLSALHKTLPDIPVCADSKQTGCLVGWSSGSKGTSPARLKRHTDWHDGTMFHEVRPEEPTLCVNPLTWRNDNLPADVSLHLGARFPDQKRHQVVTLFDEKLDAVCQDGILFLTPPPRSLPYVWDGNYHLHDFSLYYENVRANALERIQSFLSSSSSH
jgi:hypothetical protein